jgi:glycosyltransferase involved in cell wall biosynthesis
LQVAFDISDLGVTLRNPQHRRGVSRVVQEVCGALLDLARDDRLGVEFTLTAMDASAASAAFLAKQGDGPFASAAFTTREAHQRWTAFEEGAKAFAVDIADRALMRRASRWLVSRSLPLQHRITRRLPAFDPESFDLFHNPAVVPIPAYVRHARRPAFLSTLYDLIPLHYPELVHPVSVTNLRRMLATFGPEHFGICISQYVKDDFCDCLRLDPARVFVAPLAADRTRFYPCQDEARLAAVRRRYLGDGDAPYFLSLCTVERRKNLACLIRSFSRLRRENPSTRDLRLVLAGDVPDMAREQIATLVKAEGLHSQVKLTGFVEDADLAPLYSGALAFVFPSLAEGFGLPPLEAMQCGTPVVSSNRTSLPEIVGEGGLLFDPDDLDTLNQALWRVFNEPELRADLARRGLARAAHFTWERCAADHLHAYRSAVQCKQGHLAA